MIEEETIEVSDFGDAKVETKQRTPVPPFYADSTFGFGDRPNSLDEPGFGSW